MNSFTQMSTCKPVTIQSFSPATASKGLNIIVSQDDIKHKCPL